MPKSWRYYILILIFAFGGIFEMFKTWKEPGARPTTEISGGEFAGLDVRPFHVNDKDRNAKNRTLMGRKKLKLPKLKLSDVTFPKEHSFDEKKKTKKKIAKKKDKKKKKKTKQNKIVKVEKPKKEKNEDEGDEPKPPVADNGLDDSLPVGFGQAPTANDENEIPQTIEEWAAILLSQPDYKRITEFIAHFQSNEVSENVFYPIMEMMLEDSREDMNIQAIDALGATPSPTSFRILADVINDDNGYRAEIRTKSREKLSDYTSVQQLRNLKTVILSSTSVFAATLATQYLENSAKKNLNRSPAISETDGQITTESSVVSPIETQYISIANILKQLITNSETDKDFASAAGRAIDLIEELTRA